MSFYFQDGQVSLHNTLGIRGKGEHWVRVTKFFFSLVQLPLDFAAGHLCAYKFYNTPLLSMAVLQNKASLFINLLRYWKTTKWLRVNLRKCAHFVVTRMNQCCLCTCLCLYISLCGDKFTMLVVYSFAYLYISWHLFCLKCMYLGT